MLVQNNFNIDIELNKLSKKYHKDKNEVIKEALMVYKDYLNLLDEFKMWDDVSDETLLNFEKKLK